MGRPEVGIVIPAYNEGESIAEVVRGSLLSGIAVVVDDGSSDNTSSVAEAAGAQVVRHLSNRGYDAALESGFARCSELGCRYVVTIDADGQHDAQIVSTFVHHLEAGADLVVGVRDRKARWAERLFAFTTRRVFGLSDPMCGLKGYRIGLYTDLGHFDSYRSIGSELSLFALSRGAQLVEVPISVMPRSGKTRFGSGWRPNLRIIRSTVIGQVRYGSRVSGAFRRDVNSESDRLNTGREQV
jgi:glycosyltransferase involved in cell wall biosynthesis